MEGAAALGRPGALIGFGLGLIADQAPDGGPQRLGIPRLQGPDLAPLELSRIVSEHSIHGRIGEHDRPGQVDLVDPVG